MLVLKLNTIIFVLVIVVTLSVLFFFGVRSYIEKVEFEKVYRSVMCLGQSIDEKTQIEVFDIEKGCVTNKFDMTEKLRQESEKLIESISSIYVKVNAFPNKGKVLKIPMEPSYKPSTKWLTDYGINSIDEFYIIQPAGKLPFLLFLDNNYRPYFFCSEADSFSYVLLLDR